MPEHLRGVDLQQVGLVHDGDPVGHGEGLVVVVRDEQGGGAGGDEDVAHLVGEAFAQGAVQGRQRFVEQQQPGPRREGPGEGHALAFTSGERRDLTSAEARQADELEELVHPLAPRGGRHVLDLQAEGHVARHVEVTEELPVLEHQAETAPVHRQACEVLAVPGDRPRGQRLQPGHRTQQRRLAASRGPEQRDDLPWADVQAHPVDRRGDGAVVVPVVHDDVTDAQPAGRCRCRCRCRRRCRRRR